MVTNSEVRADTMVTSLRSALNEGKAGLNDVPGLLKRVIDEECWKSRVVERTGQPVEFHSFVEFVKTPPLEGLGSDIKTLERLCLDDEDALTLLRKVQLHQGARTDLVDNINEVGRTSGTSKSYTADRLQRKRPDLYKRVVSGELSTNAAAIQAGFRTKTITVPLDVERAASTLARHFDLEELQALAELFLHIKAAAMHQGVANNLIKGGDSHGY